MSDEKRHEMLGRIVTALTQVPINSMGTLLDVVTKLGNDPKFGSEITKFARKRPCWVGSSCLLHVNSLVCLHLGNVKFSARVSFTPGLSELRIKEVGSRFKQIFGGFETVLKPGVSNIDSYEIVKATDANLVFAEGCGMHYKPVSIDNVYNVLLRKLNSVEGLLSIDHSNYFFVLYEQVRYTVEVIVRPEGFVIDEISDRKGYYFEEKSRVIFLS